MDTSSGFVSTKEKGQGKPLLLLHGYHLNKEIFDGVMDALSDRRRVIAIDFPGFGQSFSPQTPWSVDDYADCVGEILDQIGNADILAHSFGARVAIKLASRGDQRIEKMLLTGAAGIKPKRRFSYYRKVAFYKLLRRFGNAEKWRKKYASPDYLKLNPVMRESFKRVVNENLAPCLTKITCPTLLVFGEKDTETPLYMAEMMKKKIFDSALIVFDGVGHFCFLERPYRFTAVAKAFFD